MYMQEQNWKLSGIVNGIDDKTWNPEYDEFLGSDGYMRYSHHNLLEGKSVNKRALQNELGLPDNPDVPLLGFIGRMDYQKGVDFIVGAKRCTYLLPSPYYYDSKIYAAPSSGTCGSHKVLAHFVER